LPHALGGARSRRLQWSGRLGDYVLCYYLLADGYEWVAKAEFTVK
jgi:hypothetical protein